ncbi:flavin reductase family protein [Aliagarivorans marinus]|uniref:flavin reductase family protein n=1 Tax=Aliagarivorans marinus TaxID=561965 RepID=UPI00047DBDF2|nr:flavin reductase family protein [Aliagarivorans marinus]
MELDFSQLTPNQRYHCMTQVIAPRPVAWILTENSKAESYNLAPFSYFNAVCSDPPLLMVSIGQRPEGGPKDTAANILSRQRCVVHIAGSELAGEVTESSRPLAVGESEVSAQALALAEFDESPLPRLANAKVALYCELYKSEEIGSAPQQLLFLEVKQVHISDEIAANKGERLKVDATALDPLGRLGGGEYWVGGEILTIDRPS